MKNQTKPHFPLPSEYLCVVNKHILNTRCVPTRHCGEESRRRRVVRSRASWRLRGLNVGRKHPPRARACAGVLAHYEISFPHQFCELESQWDSRQAERKHLFEPHGMAAFIGQKGQLLLCWDLTARNRQSWTQILSCLLSFHEDISMKSLLFERP